MAALWVEYIKTSGTCAKKNFFNPLFMHLGCLHCPVPESPTSADITLPDNVAVTSCLHFASKIMSFFFFAGRCPEKQAPLFSKH